MRSVRKQTEQTSGQKSGQTRRTLYRLTALPGPNGQKSPQSAQRNPPRAATPSQTGAVVSSPPIIGLVSSTESLRLSTSKRAVLTKNERVAPGYDAPTRKKCNGLGRIVCDLFAPSCTWRNMAPLIPLPRLTPLGSNRIVLFRTSSKSLGSVSTHNVLVCQRNV